MSERCYHIPSPQIHAHNPGVQVLLVRDAYDDRAELLEKFTGAYRVFTVRMSRFSNLNIQTNEDEYTRLQIIFRALQTARAELDAMGAPMENIDA